MKSIRIGAGQGFWGNGSYGAANMVKTGNINYLCCDALAELTLAILKKGMQKNAYAGWVNELTGLLYACLPTCKGKGIKIVCNHGGLNPLGAMEEAKRVAQSLGITGIKIAVVTGDNMADRLDDLASRGVDLSDMDTGLCYADIKDRLMFANAYIGAAPIVEALQNGADIVITGRAADSALFLAPMIYEFGWKWDDWDKLASGTLAGHLLECSAQSTGGNFLGNWQSVPHMEQIGYPIAEVSEDGSLVITKPEGSGGRVDVETVSEQMVYETLDPNQYIAPDVIADFTTPILTDLGNDRVSITGMRGKPRPEKLKVFMGYQNGWAASTVAAYSWPDALQKARKREEILRWQVEALGLDIDDFYCEYLGLNSIFGAGVALPEEDTLNEVVSKITIRTKDRKAAEKFCRIPVAWGLDGPPACGGAAGFNSKPRELLGPVSALVDRNEIEPYLSVEYLDL